MGVSDFLTNPLPIFLLELVAAVLGTRYLRRNKGDNTAKYFVWLLWITVGFEIVSTYAALAYLTDYKYLSFVKDSLIVRNIWMANIHFIVSYFLYITYFKKQLIVQRQRQILNIILLVFFASSITNLFISEVFFIAFSAFTNIAGTLALLLSIALYYFQLLRSDEVLKIGRLLPFYISIGAVILHLCLTPFFIYSNYLSESVSKDFVGTYYLVLKFTNLLVYSIYITGFIICRKNKSIY